MTFTVTYRGADGAVREERVEAAGRGECFAQCRARGIAPMGVAERRSDGKIRRSNHKTRRSNGDARLSIRKTRRSIFAAVFVMIALAGGGAWWWLDHDKTQPVQEPEAPKKPSFAKEVKPASVPKTIDGPSTKDSIQPTEVVVSPSTNNDVRMYEGQPVVHVEAFTNKAGMLVERLYTADGKRHRLTHFPPPIFKHASDRYLSTILSVPTGVEMPPLPDLSGEHNLEEEFMKSLEDEIVIEESDSNKIKDLKLRVMIARDNMKALIKSGRGFAEVLEETRRTMNENVEIRAQTLRQYSELLSNGQNKDAEAFRVKVNEVLSQMGIDEIEPVQHTKKGVE